MSPVKGWCEAGSLLRGWFTVQVKVEGVGCCGGKC